MDIHFYWEQTNLSCVESPTTAGCKIFVVTWNLRKFHKFVVQIVYSINYEFIEFPNGHQIFRSNVTTNLPAVDVLSTQEKFVCSIYKIFRFAMTNEFSERKNGCMYEKKTLLFEKFCHNSENNAIRPLHTIGIIR